MREWCACGSGINTLSKRQVRIWRTDHKHSDTPEPEADSDGSVQIGFKAND